MGRIGTADCAARRLGQHRARLRRIRSETHALRHVYGVTRRGYGASSRPSSGYDDQRLADDVLRVLDSVRIDAPVLVGHSMAGGELTTLGHQHSDRLAGLVYLDALGDPRDFPASDPAYMALFQKLPAPMRNPPSLDNTSYGAKLQAFVAALRN